MKKCPVCKTPLPFFSKQTNLKQMLWGGWTCRNCGSELDRRGSIIKRSKKKDNWFKRHPIWTAFIVIIISIAIIISLLPTNDTAKGSEKVLLTQELKDEICYEIDVYGDYCYTQGIPIKSCADSIEEKIKRIYGITSSQLLEIIEYHCP